MKKRHMMHFFLLGILFFAGCQKTCQKIPQVEPIKVAISLPIETLDPRYATSFAASRVSNLVFATLFVIGPDLNPNPWLAQGYEQIDEKTYKITLKKNLTFHDGSPLTSLDVVYTFNDLSSKDVMSPHAEKFTYVQSIHAPDEHTVIFNLKEPFSPFLTDLCGIGIVSQKRCQNRSKECQHEFIGSGPFKVKTWDRAKEAISLTPFSQFVMGVPKNPVIIRIVRDENTRILELINGKTEIVDGDISPQKGEELSQNQNLTVKEIPGLGFTYLGINVRGLEGHEKLNNSNKTRLALSKSKVRMAIAKGIDFDQIIEKVLLNKAKRASGLMPNGHWAKDNTLKPPAYDPMQAKKLLDEAGFLKGKKRLSRFSLNITTIQNRTHQSIAMLFADFLKRLDIDASVRVKDWSALYEDMQKGQFELFIATWVPVTEPNLYEWVHHSKNIPRKDQGGGNRHGYKNNEVDILIDAGKKISDETKRKEIYQKIERILIEELPYIPLWNENRTIVISKKIKGYEPKRTGSLLGLTQAYREEN